MVFSRFNAPTDKLQNFWRTLMAPAEALHFQQQRVQYL